MPEFMGPHNCDVGKHPDAKINDFRALQGNAQDTTHHVAIYNCMREFIKHKSRNKTYLSDEQLHAMELFNHHGTKVQVEGLEDECISQMWQFTGSQSRHRGHQRNDWVWVKQCQGRCYGALNGRLLWLLQQLFKI